MKKLLAAIMLLCGLAQGATNLTGRLIEQVVDTKTAHVEPATVGIWQGESVTYRVWAQYAGAPVDFSATGVLCRWQAVLATNTTAQYIDTMGSVIDGTNGEVQFTLVATNTILPVANYNSYVSVYITNSAGTRDLLAAAVSTLQIKKSAIAAGYSTNAPVYLTETDPVWAAVSNTVRTQAANGQTAYGWGDHAAAVASVSNRATAISNLAQTAYGWGDHAASVANASNAAVAARTVADCASNAVGVVSGLVVTAQGTADNAIASAGTGVAWAVAASNLASLAITQSVAGAGIEVGETNGVLTITFTATSVNYSAYAAQAGTSQWAIVSTQANWAAYSAEAGTSQWSTAGTQANFAAYAAQSGTSQWAIVATSANWSAYSADSGTSQWSVAGTQANFAAYAAQAGTSQWAIVATQANFASYSADAGTSAWATVATQANWAAYSADAGTSQWAIVATSANWSAYAAQAGTAAVATAVSDIQSNVFLNAAGLTNTANLSGTVPLAATAYTSTYAAVSDVASNVNSKVGSATNADLATYADVANLASNVNSKVGSATNADYAAVANLASNVNSTVAAATNANQLGGIAAANYPTNAGAAGEGYFAMSNGAWTAFASAAQTTQVYVAQAGTSQWSVAGTQANWSAYSAQAGTAAVASSVAGGVFLPTTNNVFTGIVDVSNVAFRAWAVNCRAIDTSMGYIGDSMGNQTIDFNSGILTGKDWKVSHDADTDPEIVNYRTLTNAIATLAPSTAIDTNALRAATLICTTMTGIGVTNAAATITNGGTLYLPAGEYSMSNITLFIPSDNFTLCGAGWSTILNATNGQTNAVINLNGHSNTVIRDLKIQANKTGGTDHDVITGSSAAEDNITIDNVWISGSDDFGIYGTVAGQDDWMIKDCRIENCDNGCVTMVGRGTVYHTTFKGNDVGVGITAPGSKVIGCMINGGSYGITMVSASCIAADNTITGTTAGIVVDGKDSIVADNDLYGLSGSGIQLDGGHGTVVGNNIYRCGNNYIDIYVNSDDNTVVANGLYSAVGASDWGIYLVAGSDRNIIANNRVSTHDQVGILELAGANSNAFYGNNCVGELVAQYSLAGSNHQAFAVTQDGGVQFYWSNASNHNRIVSSANLLQFLDTTNNVTTTNQLWPAATTIAHADVATLASNVNSKVGSATNADLAVYATTANTASNLAAGLTNGPWIRAVSNNTFAVASEQTFHFLRVTNTIAIGSLPVLMGGTNVNGSNAVYWMVGGTNYCLPFGP